MIIEFDDKKIKINKKYYSLENCYAFNAVNNKNEVMATLTFKIDKKVWNRICVDKLSTNEKFNHCGAGSALIYALEDFAFKNRIFYIEGKFFPENEFTKSFYKKLGYEIYKEGYDTFVGKYIHKENKNCKIIYDKEDELSF